MTPPVFRELTREECEALLAVSHVGRLAYTFRDRAEIEPIHYAFENGWIYGRTSEGSKLTAIDHNPYVAFEVDEVNGIFDWRSSTSALPHRPVRDPRRRALRTRGAAGKACSRPQTGGQVASPGDRRTFGRPGSRTSGDRETRSVWRQHIAKYNVTP